MQLHSETQKPKSHSFTPNQPVFPSHLKSNVFSINYMFFHELGFLYIFSHQAPHLLFQAHSPCYSWNQGGGRVLSSKNSYFLEYTTYLQVLLTYFFQVSFKMWSTQRDPPWWPYISYTIWTIHFILLPCLASCAQSRPTLCDLMDDSPPGSSVYGIFQVRILKQVAISSFRGIFLTQGWNPRLLCLLHW